MIIWLEIDTSPSLGFYRDDGAAPTTALTWRRLRSLSPIRRPLSVGGGTENSNCTVILDNGDGLLTAYFQNPPLRETARLVNSDGDLFTGTISDVRLGSLITLALEAGSVRPLSDNVPLRTTAVWGSYQNVEALPVVYGRVTVPGIQYNQDRSRFVLADHAINGVAAVRVNNVQTNAYTWANEADEHGVGIAVLTLARGLSESEDLEVDVLGKMDSDGALLENPAFVLTDFLSDVCGLPYTISDLDDFRRQTATEGLVVGGVIGDYQRSIRSTIDGLCQSIGAVWSGGMPGFARLYPVTDDSTEPSYWTATDLNSDPEWETNQRQLVTVHRFLYDYDWGRGDYQKVLEVTATDMVEDFGRVVEEVECPWVHSTRLMDAISERVAGYRSRPVWRGTLDIGLEDIPPGVYVTMSHSRAPVTGRMLTMDSELQILDNRLRLVVELPVGSAPRLTAASLSTAFAPLITAGALIEYRDGVATFTILDDNGKPLPGAKVTIDAKTSRLTDNAGRVSFVTSIGAHWLYVEAEGFSPVEVEVTV